MEKRKVPFINYIILGIIVIVTMMITFNFANKYKKKIDSLERYSPLHDILYFLKIEELDNYLLENPNIVIYLVSDDINFEINNNIKELVINNNLKDDIIAIDITKFTDQDFDKLNKKMSTNLTKENIKIEDYSNFIIIRDRKIYELLYKDKVDIRLNDLLANDLLCFLKKHEVIEE